VLSKYEIQVTKEEMDMVDTMRYKFKNIVAQSVSSPCTGHCTNF